MSGFGFYEVEVGENPSLPYVMHLPIRTYTDMMGDSDWSEPTSNFRAIFAWCVHRSMRVEVRENDDIASIDAAFKTLDGKLKGQPMSPTIAEEIETIFRKYRRNSLYFADQIAAFDFKVRWI